MNIFCLRSTCLPILVFSLAVLIGTSSSAQPLEIVLPADSPDQRTIQLEELWRIGGDDEDFLLGVIASAVLDDEGNVFLLDTQLSQVLVINPDGEETGTISREGEGPGELTRPTGIFLNNQNQIGVTQGFPGKIVLLNMDDTPGGSIKLGSNPETGGFAFVGAAQKRGDHLVVHHGFGAFDMESGKVATTTVLTTVDGDGNETARFAEHIQERELTKQVFDEAANFSELDTWTMSKENVFTVPHRDRYLINVKSLDGSIEKVISRPFEPRKRIDEDKEEMASGFRMVVNGQTLEMEKHILDFDPALNNMYVADDGRLFVETCFQRTTRLSTGVAGRFDIISDEGKLVEELTLELDEFNPDQDRLVFLDGLHFLWVRNFQSASDAMNSGFAGDDDSQDEALDELEDVEPLEVVFCRIPR